MTKSQKTGKGSNTSSVEYSPAKLRRIEAAKRRQEKNWASKAGPVEVRKIVQKDSEE